jgi:hypothetical protein
MDYVSSIFFEKLCHLLHNSLPNSTWKHQTWLCCYVLYLEWTLNNIVYGSTLVDAQQEYEPHL